VEWDFAMTGSATTVQTAARQSLFGHLALRFATHPENLATEALLYLLNTSPDCRRALARIVPSAQLAAVDDLPFQGQVSAEDGGIPDLIGRDPAGRERLILEAKFWAGLTAHEPVTYLQRLPLDVPGLLLVVSPRERFETLGPKLVERCDDKGIAMVRADKASGELLVWSVDGFRYVALVSWRVLLDALRHEVRAGLQPELLSDVDQLDGLCAQMDREGFIPFREAELTGFELPQRVLHFIRILRDVVDRSLAQGMTSRQGLRADATDGRSYAYLLMCDVGLTIEANFDRWLRRGQGPLWLGIKNQRFRPVDKSIRTRLLPLGDRVTESVAEPGHLLINLRVPTHKDYDDVVDAVLSQIEEVWHVLGGGPPQLPSTVQEPAIVADSTD
jgi:hypothetical protein